MAQWAAFFVARHSECRTLIDTDLNRKPVGLRPDSIGSSRAVLRIDFVGEVGKFSDRDAEGFVVCNSCGQESES